MLMQVVETYKNIKGDQKKNIVIKVLRMFVKNNCTPDESQNINLLIDLALPSIIDTIISIDKKKIKIKVGKFLKKFGSCCK